VIDLVAFGFDHILFPPLRRGIDAIEILQELLGERLGGLPVRRHVDAARFHHRRVDQAVDLFEKLHAVPSEIALGAGLFAGRQIIAIEGDTDDRNQSEKPDHKQQFSLER
jgi:hypothetical protein